MTRQKIGVRDARLTEGRADLDTPWPVGDTEAPTVSFSH